MCSHPSAFSLTTEYGYFLVCSDCRHAHGNTRYPAQPLRSYEAHPPCQCEHVSHMDRTRDDAADDDR